MTTSEQHRHEFFDFLRDQWGPERAGQLMGLLPPAGIPELTTKADLAVLRAELVSEFSGFRAEMHRAFARQTRIYVLSCAAIWVSGLGLAFTAARFA